MARRIKFLLPGLSEAETLDLFQITPEPKRCLALNKTPPKKIVNDMIQNIESVLTDKQRLKYCIMAEGRVLGEFVTLEKAQKAQQIVWPHMATFLYHPHIPSCKL
jgi:hypothetical protein